MKILLVSLKGDGAWFVWLLKHNGHDVEWICGSARDADSLGGIIPKPREKAVDPAQYDLVVFDSTGAGDSADYARTLTPTIGDSTLADKLEKDRVYGIEAMERAGIRVPKWRACTTPDEGIEFIHELRGKRCVFKPIGDAESAMSYVPKDSSELIECLPEMVRKLKGQGYVLQEFVAGTEVSTEAWFNGHDWIALNHTIELKKFMAGDVGPNTGCSGNIVWMPERPTPIFEQGLAKIRPLLEQSGYVGMVDLNTIVTEGEIYGLEWTPRFGYEGTCNLTRLLPIEFGEFLHRVASAQPMVLSSARAKFSATIRVSVPPYPTIPTNPSKYRVPVSGLDLDKLEAFYLADVHTTDDGKLETSGTYNGIGSPIGLSETIKGAFDECEIAIKRIKAPDLQYRTDCAKVCQERYQTLERQGWLRPLSLSVQR